MPSFGGRRKALRFSALRDARCAMPRKPEPPPVDLEQFKRFTDLAREVGADTDPETLGRVFDKVARLPKSQPPQSVGARGSAKPRTRKVLNSGAHYPPVRHWF
jgi:hypothetical protein